MQSVEFVGGVASVGSNTRSWGLLGCGGERKSACWDLIYTKVSKESWGRYDEKAAYAPPLYKDKESKLAVRIMHLR